MNPAASFSVNGGPLICGGLGNAQVILGRFSVNGSAQLTPDEGVHATFNLNGGLGGPSAGTPSANISGAYSKCRSLD